MADLLDIAPSAAVETVQLGDDEGQTVDVRGITISAMAAIIAKFAELKTIAAGAAGSNFIPLMITGCAAAIGPIIAAGVGHFGEKEYEQHAARMMPEQQMKLLQVIVRLTFPNGLNAFMDDVKVLMDSATDGEKPKTARIRSSSKSPSPSSPSAETSDSRQTMQ